MNYTASDVYGFGPGPQPTGSSAPNPAGQGEPLARTTPRNPGGINSTMILVALLGLALGLIHFSVRVAA